MRSILVALLLGMVACANVKQQTALMQFYNEHCGQQWPCFPQQPKFKCWNATLEPDECQWIGVKCDTDGVINKLLLSNSGVCGSFPTQLFRGIRTLVSVSLDSNHLHGALPALLAEYPLERLSVRHNPALNGSLSMFSAHPSVTTLYLDGCGFTKLPAVWPPNLSTITAVDNALQGPLPVRLPANITQIDLHNNRLSGSIDCCTRSNSLEVLSLGNNALSGALPVQWSCDSLRILYLSKNNFSGDVPNSGLSRCAKLQSFLVSSNQLTGALSFFLHRSQLYPLRIEAAHNLLGSVSWTNLLANSFLAGIDVSMNPDLQGSVSDYEARNLVGYRGISLEIDARGTAMRHSGVSRGAFEVDRTRTDTYPAFNCFGIRTVPSQTLGGVHWRLPPKFFNHSNCYCVAPLCGKPPDCQPPPEFSSCFDDGLSMVFNQNFYPFYESPDSPLPDRMARCPLFENGKSMCNANGTAIIRYGEPLEGVCSQGSEGRLCAECEEGYYRVTAGCKRCEEPSVVLTSAFGAVGVLLLVIFLVASQGWLLVAEVAVTIVLVFLGGVGEGYVLNVLVMVIIFQLVELLHMQSSASGSQAGLSVLGSHRISVPGMMKVSLWYFQMSALLNEDVFPASLSGIFNVISVAAVFASGPECSPWFPTLNAELGSLLKAIIVPFALCACLVVMLFSKHLILKCRRRYSLCGSRQPQVQLLQSEGEQNQERPQFSPSIGQQLASITLFVIYATYTDLSLTIMETFQCEEGYLVKKPFFVCAGAQYNLLRAASFALLPTFVLAVPIVLTLLLWFNRKKLTSDHGTEYVLGFLYESYKDEFCFWEVFQFARRLVLVFLVSFGPSYSSTTGSFILTTLLLASVIEIQVQPFKFRLEALLDVSACLVILLSYAISQSVRLDVSTRSTREFSSSPLVGQWIAVALNFAYIFAILFIFLVVGIRVIIKWYKTRKRRQTSTE